MVLLVCILKDYRHVEALLLGFLELEISGATVLDARGMGQMLVQEHPLFIGARDLFPGAGSDSHVVFCVTDGAKAAAGLKLLDRAANGIERKGAGVGFTVPLGQVVGLSAPFQAGDHDPA
jgi:hypothetical protein